jgi:hypothetical protein
LDVPVGIHGRERRRRIQLGQLLLGQLHVHGLEVVFELRAFGRSDETLVTTSLPKPWPLWGRPASLNVYP